MQIVEMNQQKTKPKNTDTKKKQHVDKSETKDVPEELPIDILKRAQGIGGPGANNGTEEELRQLFEETVSELKAKGERALWEFTRRHHRYAVVKTKSSTRAKSFIKAYAGRVVLWNKHRLLLKPNGNEGASLIRPPRSLAPENATFIP